MGRSYTRSHKKHYGSPDPNPDLEDIGRAMFKRPRREPRVRKRLTARSFLAQFENQPKTTEIADDHR